MPVGVNEVERHCDGAIDDCREGQNRRQVEDKCEQGKESLDRSGIASTHREFGPRPSNHPAQCRLGRRRSAKDEHKSLRRAGPALARGRIVHLLAGPADQSRRVHNHCDAGQNLAGESVDLGGQAPKQSNPLRFRGLGVMLRRDQRLQLRYQLCPLLVALQRVDELL